MYISLTTVLFVLGFWLWLHESNTPEAQQERRRYRAAWRAYRTERRTARQRQRQRQQQARPHVYGLSPVVARLAWRAGFRTYWHFTHDLARCGSDWQARLTVCLAYAARFKEEQESPPARSSAGAPVLPGH
jgi:hypothetical protein